MNKPRKVIIISLNIIMLLSIIFFSLFVSPYQDHLGLDTKIVDYDALDVLKVVWILLLVMTITVFSFTEQKRKWFIWYAIISFEFCST